LMPPKISEDTNRAATRCRGAYGEIRKTMTLSG
jgi:hypothetical protein